MWLWIVNEPIHKKTERVARYGMHIQPKYLATLDEEEAKKEG